MKVKITIELDADDDQEALVELLEVLKDIQVDSDDWQSVRLYSHMELWHGQKGIHIKQSGTD